MVVLTLGLLCFGRLICIDPKKVEKISKNWKHFRRGQEIRSLKTLERRNFLNSKFFQHFSFVGFLCDFWHGFVLVGGFCFFLELREAIAAKLVAVKI